MAREPVVVEGAAERSEDAHRELDHREETEGRRAGDTGGRDAARVAAEAQPGHEGGHDERYGGDADAGVEGEQPLPDHLVHEGGGAAQQERGGHERHGHPLGASLANGGHSGQDGFSATFAPGPQAVA